MPTYQIPAPRPNSQSTDPWADAAKAFMQVPGYADSYLQNMQQPRITHGPHGAFGDIYGGGPAMSPSDRDLLAGALTAEGAGIDDMRYIASVIGNRVNSGRWGDLRGTILAPGQFSAFNELTGYAGGQGGNDLWRNPTADAYRIADEYLSGQLYDRTGGAMNYYQPELADPAWGGEGFYSLPGSRHVFGTAR